MMPRGCPRSCGGPPRRRAGSRCRRSAGTCPAPSRKSGARCRGPCSPQKVGQILGATGRYERRAARRPGRGRRAHSASVRSRAAATSYTASATNAQACGLDVPLGPVGQDRTSVLHRGGGVSHVVGDDPDRRPGRRWQTNDARLHRRRTRPSRQRPRLRRGRGRRARAEAYRRITSGRRVSNRDLRLGKPEG